MNHAEVRAVLGDYMEGDLDLERRALVDSHLDGCNDCSRELDELTDTVSLLRGLPEPEVPFDLANEVMRRVRAGEADTSALARFGSWLADLMWPGLAVPTAAMLAAFVMAVGSGRIAVPMLGAPDAGAIVAARPAESTVARANPVIPDATALGRLATSPPPIPAPSFAAHSNPSPATSPEAAVQPRTADDWLEVLAQDPVRFARGQAGLSEAERLLWARQLARRAVDRGIAGELAGQLVRSSSREAQAFARIFQGEAEAYAGSR